MSSDPIGFEGGINDYVYANANPVMYTDPDGLVGIPSFSGGGTHTDTAFTTSEAGLAFSHGVVDAVGVFDTINAARDLACGNFTSAAGNAASALFKPVKLGKKLADAAKKLTRAEKNDIATLRKPHGEVHVNDINQARRLLDNMLELRPATQNRLTPNPGGGLANGFKDPKGTYRGDLINKSNPAGPVHPGVQNPNHANYPHFNITLPDGNKSAIIISGS